MGFLFVNVENSWPLNPSNLSQLHVTQNTMNTKLITKKDIFTCSCLSCRPAGFESPVLASRHV